MEEILIAIFEFLIEVVLQILVELPWDWLVSVRESRRKSSDETGGWVVLSLLMGAAIGVLSLFVRPNTAIRTSAGRIAYLFLAPPLSALLSYSLTQVLAARGRPWLQPRRHAICAFCFALVLTVIRFTYAHRPQ